MPPATARSTTANAPTALVLPWRSPLAIGLCLILLVLMFARLFMPVEAAWRTDSNYSHGYLIPLLCGYLAIRSWQRAGTPGAGDSRMALMNLIPGGVVLLAGTVVPWPLITFAAMVLILRGILVVIGGREWAGHFTAPLLFSFFMFPVPVTWTSTLALWLQDVVTRLSAFSLERFVICLRTGTVLHVLGAPHPLQVGEQCSGLRQLVGFLAFSVLLGMLLDRPMWHRAVLVVLAIPFAVFANVIRVLLMCVGSVKFGSGWMDGWLHHAPAAFTLPVGFGLLLGMDYVLSRIFPVQESVPDRPTGTISNLSTRLRPALICLGVLFVAQMALWLHLRSAGPESFPLLKAGLSDIPMVVGSQWHGTDRPNLDQVVAKLPYSADDLILRDYRPGGGNLSLQVYSVYSRRGEDRKHHPEVCVREVTGAPEDLGARARIYVDGEGNRPIQRFVFRTDTVGKTTVYYWHYTLRPEGRASFLQSLHQRLGQAVPSVTVQVSVPTADPAVLKLIETDYLPALDSAFRDRILPASAIMDATRLPIALTKD